MEMDTQGYHAIILNVNVKYCLLNLSFVCFALSHTSDPHGQKAGSNKIMNLYLIASGADAFQKRLVKIKMHLIRDAYLNKAVIKPK
jgi:hypothetical protein